MGVRGVVDNTLKFTSVPAPVRLARAEMTLRIETATRGAPACDPAHRFKSAGDFVAALDRSVSGDD